MLDLVTQDAGSLSIAGFFFQAGSSSGTGEPSSVNPPQTGSSCKAPVVAEAPSIHKP